MKLNPAQIGSYLTGKRVMVTGRAGSIGSELCSRIAKYKPQQLIIVKRNESILYELELELKQRNLGLNTMAALDTIQTFVFSAYGRKYKPSAMRVVVGS